MKQLLLSITLVLLTATSAKGWAWQFVDVTQQAGFDYEHGVTRPIQADIISQQVLFSGGVAVGDYDNDGWVDLYVVRGEIGPNLLFRNRGDGSFEEVAEHAGLVSPKTKLGSGPVFADYTGDGNLDLFIGGVRETKPRLFRNNGDGTFEDITPAYGIGDLNNSYSAAFGDYDRDGDLDLYVSHWILSDNFNRHYLHENDGSGGFQDASIAAGLGNLIFADFTPNFADIDNDGWPDLLVTADFEQSRVFINNHDGTFKDITDETVISDENGMGAAIGDYDNDGDLDWFVSSIWDPRKEMDNGDEWGKSGNRLYRNRGDGSFEDVTDLAGVRIGYWGWGSCFADFNNDGHLDIFHVNGFYRAQSSDRRADIFMDDPARMFVSNGDGTFSEQSEMLGLADTGQGRGVSCFDYDRDGDIDIFIANFGGPPRLYRNDSADERHYLAVNLKGSPPNTEAIGARIYVTANGMTQMRELRAGSNFESQNPASAHFGLDDATVVTKLEVVWPDGKRSVLTDVVADRRITLTPDGS